MSYSETQPPNRSGENKPKSFSFGFSFGQKPSVNDPSFQELRDEARRQAAESPDGIGGASRPIASLELADGILRIGGRKGPVLELDLDAGQTPFVYHEPFPALAAFRRWFHRTVVTIAIGLPVAFIGLGIATHQTTETTFYMAFFGLFLSVMLVSSFVPRRSWISSLIEGMLDDAARSKMRHARQTPSVEEATLAETRLTFTIKCESCGTSFTPAPPAAVCPQCLKPALTE